MFWGDFTHLQQHHRCKVTKLGYSKQPKNHSVENVVVLLYLQNPGSIKITKHGSAIRNICTDNNMMTIKFHFTCEGPEVVGVEMLPELVYGGWWDLRTQYIVGRADHHIVPENQTGHIKSLSSGSFH